MKDLTNKFIPLARDDGIYHICESDGYTFCDDYFRRPFFQISSYSIERLTKNKLCPDCFTFPVMIALIAAEEKRNIVRAKFDKEVNTA
jgi:hypothetical protein